jgi:hypothetical protein
MAQTVQVVDAAKTSTIVELHGSAATDIKTIWFSVGAPVVWESWFESPDAADAVLAKAQDRPRTASLSIVIPAQTDFAALRTKIDGVRDAFFTLGNFLKIVYSNDVQTRYHYLFPTRLANPLASEEIHRSAILYKQVTRWDFDFRIKSTADGLSRYDVL